MKIFITGANGYIGNHLAQRLARQGNQVHALVRSEKGSQLAHENITIFRGDILDKAILKKAIKDCRQVYHTAAKVGAWARDPSEYYDVNVRGTQNVLDAAVIEGIEKFVYTSSSGVLGPSAGEPVTEQTVRNIPFAIEYDQTKKMGEDLVIAYSKKGLCALSVNPSKVFGPGATSHSLTTNAIIQDFIKKKFTFIPYPGTFKVCFAFIDDVVTGHILAMEKGRPGEIYILGGNNISYFDFFDRIRSLAKMNARIIQVPKSIVRTWAHFQQLNNKITGAAIRFPVKAVDHAYNNYIFSSEKAIKELGYKITPLDQAISDTIQYINNHQHA
jgi:nucleoside-diphosphate-sugar epimerase